MIMIPKLQELMNTARLHLENKKVLDSLIVLAINNMKTQRYN